MSLRLDLKRPGEVARAQRVFAAIDARDPFGHRNLKRECAMANPYVLVKLARRGLIYDNTTGAIRASERS